MTLICIDQRRSICENHLFQRKSASAFPVFIPDFVCVPSLRYGVTYSTPSQNINKVGARIIAPLPIPLFSDLRSVVCGRPPTAL